MLVLSVPPSAASSAEARGTLAFTSTRCIEDRFGGASLWIARDDGTGARALAGCSTDPDGGGGAGHPTLAPSGTEVAFVDGKAAAASLDVLSIDGSGRGRRVSLGEGRIEEPDWSPVGDLIAVGGHLQSAGGLPDNTDSDPIRISPDSDVFLLDPMGRTVRRIVDGGGDEFAPRFSPDGQRVEFTQAGFGAVYPTFHSVALDGSDERRLSAGWAPEISYSRDSRYLEFFYGRHLWTVATTGRDLSGWIFGFDPAWGRGATLFSAHAPGRTGPPFSDRRIHRLDLDGERPAPEQLTTTPANDSAFDWTDGSGHVSRVADERPPVAVLLAADEPWEDCERDRECGRRPLAWTTTTAGRPPVVDRRALRYAAFDRSGIDRLRFAISREARDARRGRRCRFLGLHGYSRARPCERPPYRRLGARDRWTTVFARARPGVHTLRLLATDGEGNVSPTPLVRRVRLR